MNHHSVHILRQLNMAIYVLPRVGLECFLHWPYVDSLFLTGPSHLLLLALPSLISVSLVVVCLLSAVRSQGTEIWMINREGIREILNSGFTVSTYSFLRKMDHTFGLKHSVTPCTFCSEKMLDGLVEWLALYVIAFSNILWSCPLKRRISDVCGSEPNVL